VTINNGIISIVCTKSGATINQITYTYNNGSGTQSQQLLSGGYDGGQLYWETGGFSTGSFTYSVVSNTANYVEIDLLSTSATNGALDIHFSMLKGSPGFYVTPIWMHRAVDGAMALGETRDNIYAGSMFNWMCVDATRNRLMEVTGGSAIGVLNAPVEVSLWTNGIYQGQYEDKYKYSADLGVQRCWGWCSVGTGGKNVGIWNISATAEYYNGGPMKRELMEHIGTTILNMLNGGHYGGGHDGSWNAGEVWTKVYGPYFIYCNNVTNTLTDMTQASTALRNDALAQAAAEQTAWPYSWFGNASYVPAAGRGTIIGQITIADSGNPNASAANLYVGAIIQPLTTDAVYDFQEWMKPYQFWVKTDTNGNFTIPNVVAGNNYTLYAFGPGAAGTFQSQNQTGGNAPNTLDIPATPFSVTVTAGTTNNLGTVTWTPNRVGPTVFELGYPDRTAGKFRHGDDFWVSDIGPAPAAPSPIWSKYIEYPFDFPNGPNYIVGQSRWTTDWNYVQPVLTDGGGNFDGTTSTITFNLASSPATGSQASFYIAICSDYQGPLEIAVNGTQIAGSTGYFPAYNSSGNESDTTIRQGLHGIFSDNRINFAGSLLKLGQNTITINMRKGGYFANHAMYDYLRLELTGYVPPPPTGVVVYPGNNCNLVTWPVIPGATSYNLYRSVAGTSYALLTNGVLGPVCGSGTNKASYLDSSAVNGANYNYEVQSANPAGISAASSPSNAATPDPGLAATAPAAPTGLTATPAGSLATPGIGQVNLSWTASPGANYYSIQRSTVVNNGDGTNVILGTILLNNTNTTTSYVDATPTCGSIYMYAVSATSAGGTSPVSAGVIVKPVPPAPPDLSGGLTASFVSTTNVYLLWPPVTGAIGYLVQRSSPNTNTYFLLASVTETNYTDYGLSPTTTYYYKITPVNEGGMPAGAVVSLNGPPPAPITLSAVPGYHSVLLNWSAVPGAASYVLRRGTTSGVDNYTVATGYAGTSYTNTSLVNGTTYYYLVAATGTYGTGTNSLQVSATLFNGANPNIVFTGATANGVVVTGTGGLAGVNYYVLGTTNPALPRANWTPVVTNFFDGSGGFNFTNGFNLTNAPQFFQLEVP
jgi:fibronectin type 3 domain-containing protein